MIWDLLIVIILNQLIREFLMLLLFFWYQRKEFIEERLNHYTPYRPITDSEFAKGARKALNEVLGYANCVITASEEER